jgi:hypothetical protein
VVHIWAAAKDAAERFRVRDEARHRRWPPATRGMFIKQENARRPGPFSPLLSGVQPSPPALGAMRGAG